MLQSGPALLNVDSWRADMGSSSTARGYGYKWQKAREGFLKVHPLCEMHKERDVFVPSTVVDHKIAHRGDMSLFWDRSNWQALCKPCHDSYAQQRDNAAKGLQGPGGR